MNRDELIALGEREARIQRRFRLASLVLQGVLLIALAIAAWRWIK